MFKSLEFSGNNDFQLPKERPQSRSSWGLRSSTSLRDKTVKFMRRDDYRILNLGIYRKTAQLLKVLREEFENERLTYFLNPETKKEVCYEELFNLDVVLVLEDADVVEYMIHYYKKSTSKGAL
ncbi:hypothetical protein FDP41_000096 [Naegleria fowleri]|uniref:Uncharacterized protein n=1 Tax=Naegleria fowleri TaxID=5763 RepID=A0A6A5C6X9_NAEFO|nr:uncharacterized protein FDP41_000096 [Naegleria fowleri]KAF0985057.1 hypothetical protein FDP41_000096 [Naegleria fowleri]